MISPLFGRIDLTRLDNRMKSLLERIRELEMQQFAVNRKIERLQWALGRSSSFPDELVFVPGGLDCPCDPEPAEQYNQDRRQLIRNWHRASLMAAQMSNSASAREAVLKRLTELCFFCRTWVEQAVARHQDRIRKLSDSCNRLGVEFEQLRKQTNPVPNGMFCVQSR